jgi:hypothetical protein
VLPRIAVRHKLPTFYDSRESSQRRVTLSTVEGIRSNERAKGTPSRAASLMALIGFRIFLSVCEL